MPILTNTAPFPRRAMVAYGGHISPQSDIAYADLYLSGWTRDTSTGNTVFPQLKAINPNLEVITYLAWCEQPNQTNLSTDATLLAYVENNNLFLRQYGTKVPLSGGDSLAVNVCAPDISGKCWPEYQAEYAWNNWITPVASIDGVFLDVFNSEYPIISHSVLKGGAAGTGTATSGTTTTINDTGKSWTASALVNYFVCIQRGKNAMERRKISANTATQLTVGSAFSNAIDTTSVYGIVGYGNTATGGGANTLTDSGAAWAVNEFAKGLVEIVGGTGAGQVRQVNTNTATQLTTINNWTVQPDATSVYEVYPQPATSATQMWPAGNPNLGILANVFPNDATPMPMNIYSARFTSLMKTNNGRGAARLRALADAAGRPFKIYANDGYSLAKGTARAFDSVDSIMFENAFQRPTQAWNFTNHISAVRQINLAQPAVDYPLFISCGTNSLTAWDQARYDLCATAMTDGICIITAGSYSNSTMIVLDEDKLPSWGAAIDPPQFNPATGKSYWRREFENALVIWNQSASPVTVVEPGWKRFAASSYGSQDTTLNNGGTAGGAGFSLGAAAGVVLIRE